jgi:hypothetical protein
MLSVNYADKPIKPNVVMLNVVAPLQYQTNSQNLKFPKKNIKLMEGGKANLKGGSVQLTSLY